MTRNAMISLHTAAHQPMNQPQAHSQRQTYRKQALSDIIATPSADWLLYMEESMYVSATEWCEFLMDVATCLDVRRYN